MLTSPLQLKEYNFLTVSITARDIVFPLENRPFDMEGVVIKEEAQWGIASEDRNNPTAFGLKLHISIDNTAEIACPYDVEVVAQGLFIVDESIELEKREAMLLVNGCAILYSVIREQILSITCRGSFGPIMMPTVNFLDHQNIDPTLKKKS